MKLAPSFVVLTLPFQEKLTLTHILNFALFKIKDYVLVSAKHKQGVLWQLQESVK